MVTACLVKKLNGFTGDARLYKLSEPVWDEDDKKTTEYVVVSAASVMGAPETYIFPADENGKVIAWGELPGSFKGGLDHAKALRGAGWNVED